MEPAPQMYFQEQDIESICQSLFQRLEELNPGLPPKAAGAHTLGVVHNLRNRLGESRKVIQFLYTDLTLVPKPIALLVQDYLDGRYTQPQVESFLDSLEQGMRRYFFRNKIPFDEPESLPQNAILDLQNAPGLEQEFQRIRGGYIKDIEAILREYDCADAATVAAQIYDQASKSPVQVTDFSILLDELATVVARRTYSQIMGRIGLRHPSPRELAQHYLNTYATVQRKLMVGKHVLSFGEGNHGDQEELLLEQRMEQKVYEQELSVYNNLFGNLLINP